MKLNQHDWTDAVRAALRDAEAAPPAGGWERLERALAESEAAKTAAAAVRVPRWRIRVRRGLSAAAAVLLLALTGGYMWRAADRLPQTLPAAGPAVADVQGGLATDGVRADETDEVGDAEVAAERLAEALAAPRGTVAGNLAALSSSRRGQHVQDVAADAAAERAVWVDAASEESSAAPKRGADEARAAKRADAVRDVVSDAAGEQSRDAAPAVAGNDRPRTAARGDWQPSAAVRRPSVPAERRSSFALHAAGMPGSGGGGAMRGMIDAAAPSEGPVVLTTLEHAPGDVVANVVRDLSQVRPSSYDYRHRQPVSVGLAFRYAFAYGLSLETGVNYTLLRSDVTSSGRAATFDQRLHFVGVPLRMNWQFLERGPLSLYIGAGGQVEKCVSARFGERRVDETGVQWSLSAVAGAQCRLGGPVGLYFEPEASWYLNDTSLRTSRTDRPTTFTLRLGVRFSF